MYQHMTSQWIEQLPALSPNMAISAKILGIMRNLLVYGYDRSGEKNDTQGFFDLAVQHLRDFYQFCTVSKFVPAFLLVSKLVVDVAVVLGSVLMFFSAEIAIDFPFCCSCYRDGRSY
jgi:hypothetical protein